MKYLLFTAVAVVLVVPAGCGRRANQGTALGPNGEKLMMQPLPKLKVKQGKEEEFSVAVSREKIKGPVQLTFSGLPPGASLVEKDTTIPEDKNDIILTIKVDKGAAPCPETPVTVKAKMAGLPEEATSTLRLEIAERLAHKEDDKEAFVKDMEGRLDKVKKQFEQNQEKLKDLKEDTKAKFQKQLGKLQQSYSNARKALDNLKATPLETWENKKAEVINGVTSVEKSAAQFQTDLDGAK